MYQEAENNLRISINNAWWLEISTVVFPLQAETFSKVFNVIIYYIKYCDLEARYEFRVAKLSDDISFQKCHR